MELPFHAFESASSGDPLGNILRKRPAAAGNVPSKISRWAWPIHSGVICCLARASSTPHARARSMPGDDLDPCVLRGAAINRIEGRVRRVSEDFKSGELEATGHKEGGDW